MPSYRMYWANETRFSPIADVMSRNRFEKLRSCFHINDNSKIKTRDHPEYDKLFKVRPFIESLKQNFEKIEPEEHNAVDEIMIPCKSHTALKQYIKSKPHKWGIKMFARAGASGIVYDFDIYIGKGTTHEPSDLGISGDIVVKLAKNIPKNQNFKIYTDNYFTSFNLFTTLQQMGILSVGTVRTNRLKGLKFKEDKVMKTEGRGSYEHFTEENKKVVAVKWFDNKGVTLLSTYVGLQPIEEVRRWSQTEKKYVHVPRPNIVKIYNMNMGGVDLNDMLVALYRTRIGVKRYYLKIFFHLMDISIVNSWLLYRRDCRLHDITSYKKLVVFRSEIGHAFLQSLSKDRKRVGRPSSRESSPQLQRKRTVNPQPIDDVRYDGREHWPVHIEPKQRCRSCQAYSRLACEKCKIPLCLTKDRNCFKAYHIKS
ncbi:piggyBac transposable element-derived protein 2-like [Photinus pyralis]|nr:piggyBac transposable element-derived protein 2-like [Photinus pyralis]